VTLSHGFLENKKKADAAKLEREEAEEERKVM
jgi:hypothetical protein